MPCEILKPFEPLANRPVRSHMKRAIAKLLKLYERLNYERLPIASLLRQATEERVPPEPSLKVGSVEVHSLNREFISSEMGTPLAFRIRLAPRSYFSAWLGAHGPCSGGTFMVDVQAGSQKYALARIQIEGARAGNLAGWRRLKLSLSKFSGQEVTLLLSIEVRRNERPVMGWAEPRILRKRTVQEHYANIRSRLAQGGISALLRSTRAVLKGHPDPNALFAEYPRWLRAHTPTVQHLARLAERAATFRYQPLISILTPTFDTDPEVLRKCIQSARTQVYEGWELCICDDGSSSEAVRDVILECARQDSRIKAKFLPENRGIAEATNTALGMASGEFIGLLDHDDELSPDALYENVLLLQQHINADIIYSDEDKIDVQGNYCEPFFKPDWSPELLLSCMYTCHFSLYRRQLICVHGGFRSGFEGAQDYDLMLRLIEHTDKVFHIPKILYHWRKSPVSTAADAQAKSCTTDKGLCALREHLQRVHLDSEVMPTDRPNSYRVKPAIRGNPLVSIIIPHKDHPDLLQKCIQSIKSRTSSRNYELIIVDNGSTSPQAQEYLSRLPYRVISYNFPFNFSRMNNLAARECKGDYLLLLNDDTEVISPNWLTAMLGYAQLPQIGAVGAKLYYPDGSIQHAGVVLGMRGIAGHWLYRLPGSSRGYFNSLHVVRNFSAVTAACLLLRREVFESIRGFDEALAVSYNDVDLCLRIREAGYRIVWVPEAELYHCEFATRPKIVLDPKEVEYMEKKWGAILRNDPYYNPNLTLESGALALRF
jgi:GT2 family glycosyltransferase